MAEPFHADVALLRDLASVVGRSADLLEDRMAVPDLPGDPPATAASLAALTRRLSARLASVAAELEQIAVSLEAGATTYLWLDRAR